VAVRHDADLLDLAGELAATLSDAERSQYLPE
jgi:hypothetical protein